MRLFFALELPADVQRALSGAQSPENRDYRWVDPSLMHITLAFLGEQPEERLGDLEAIGMRAAREGQPGVLELGPAGQFGGGRVLWVGLRGDVERLAQLQQALATALRGKGFAIEGEFRPHITLARRRERARSRAPEGWPPKLPHAAIPIRELTLMQSRLSPRGPSYTPLFHFQIGG